MSAPLFEGREPIYWTDEILSEVLKGQENQVLVESFFV
jgi:hypothetical protein